MSKKSFIEDIGDETILQGVVIRSTGSWYAIQTPDGIIESKIRGKFRLQDKTATNPIAVGDSVSIRVGKDETGLITDIHPRRTKLSRRAAGRRATIEHIIVANVDMAWCVQSVAMPKFNAGFVDRFLVMTEIEELDAGIVINKADLLDIEDETLREELDQEIGFWQTLYEEMGYEVHLVSAETGEGLRKFKTALQDKIHVFSGPSGVGKSSLLNRIEPSLHIRTGEVSESTSKGKHTTTSSELHPLSFGGFIADTPGLREFGIWDLTPEDLGSFFVDFRSFLGECQFHNCTHDHEPKCAIRAATEREEVAPERYASYLNILASLKQGRADVGR